MWDDAIIFRYASLDSLRADGDSSADIEFDDHPELRSLRDPARRATWIAGRRLARRLLLELQPDWDANDTQIAIRSRNATGQGVSPEVTVNGVKQEVSLSISHTDRGVLAAASLDAEVGVDLVDCEQFAPGKLMPWFTDAERRRLEETENGVREQAVFWAVKEAVYKAVHEGESFAPKSFDVLHDANGELLCQYRNRSLRDNCRIRVTEQDGHIAALAVVKRTTARSSR